MLKTLKQEKITSTLPSDKILTYDVEWTEKGKHVLIVFDFTKDSAKLTLFLFSSYVADRNWHTDIYD